MRTKAGTPDSSQTRRDAAARGGEMQGANELGLDVMSPARTHAHGGMSVQAMSVQAKVYGGTVTQMRTARACP